MKRSELNRFVECGVDSFSGYALYNHFLSKKFYQVQLRIIMKSLLLANKDAVVYADSPEVNGFALWLPPGYKQMEPLNYALGGGAWRMLFVPGGIRSVGRIDDTERYAFDRKMQITGGADLYLYALGVKKVKQKMGFATKLVRPMLEYANLVGLSAYLETYDEANVAIYEHLGFKLHDVSVVPESNLTHYPMVYKG